MKNLFDNATLKLTLIFMGILTLICFLFSYNWYQIATEELSRGVERQRQVLNRPRIGFERDVLEEILQESNERYEDAKTKVLGRIVLTNLIIISSGTLGAYYLARRSLEPIEKAHAEQMRFTADASHELRTPLTAMQTEIQVALRDKKLTKTEAVELLNSNLEELAKLSSLSEGLLKLARQDESVQMEFTTLSLDAIVSAAAERVATAAKHRKISIIYEVTNLKIEGNYDALVELLVILLDNAIKYSPQKTSVEVVAVDHRSHVDVSIKDQGVGIRASDQEHIFERFYRADNSRSAQNASGHGLGLSIAKNIADIHGARLSVSSPGPQQGATFTVRLNKS